MTHSAVKSRIDLARGSQELEPQEGLDMIGLGHDIRYAIRTLRQRPSFTLVAVLCLAIGIGVNSMIFSITNAIVLRPLPFENRDRMVVIEPTPPPERQWLGNDVSGPTFLDWRENCRSFEELSALSGRNVNLTGEGEPQRVMAMIVSPNAVAATGSQTLIRLGRGFTREEGEVGKDGVVMVSHRLWQQRYGGDEDLVGQEISINHRPHTVVGVLSPNLGFLDLFGELWLPLTDTVLREGDRHDRYLSTLAVLKPEVSVREAQAEMEALTRQLAERYPETERGWGIEVRSIVDELVKEFRNAVVILHVTVGFVLLIACANVANLLLARGSGRRQEVAIRTALGAGRVRLVRQMLVESVCLSLLGGLVALLVAIWGVEVLMSISPTDIPRLTESGVDHNVLLFTLLVAALTGIVFGLAPALQLSGSAQVLRSRRQDGPRQHQMLGLFVAGEVALAVMLLIGAGLVIRSLERLERVDPGFDPGPVLSMSLDLPAVRYAREEDQASFSHRLLTEVAAVPGIEKAAVTSLLPLRRGGASRLFEVEGRPTQPGEANVAQFRQVSDTYFDVMGIPALQGRTFALGDDASAPSVAIINETLARRYWAGENALGKTILVPSGGGGRRPNVPLRIVGVIGDVMVGDLGLERKPIVYMPFAQMPSLSMSLVVRTRGTVTGLAEDLRRTVWSIDPDQAVSRLVPMRELLDEDLLLQRFGTQVLTAFSTAALALAALGIYGVMLFSVSRRTHELGIRIALGASRIDVLQGVLRSGLSLVAIGMVAGVLGAVMLTRFLTSFLHGVSTTDPTTYILVCLFLAAVALVACYVPARRATRVDPTVALRLE